MKASAGLQIFEFTRKKTFANTIGTTKKDLKM